MNPYTSKFTNETLLFKTSRDWVIEDVQAVYDEQTWQVLFMIKYEHDDPFEQQYWIMLVEFDAMKINMKKQYIPTARSSIPFISILCFLSLLFSI